MRSDHNLWTVDTLTAALILAVLEVDFRGLTPWKRATKTEIAWQYLVCKAVNGEVKRTVLHEGNVRKSLSVLERDGSASCLTVAVKRQPAPDLERTVPAPDSAADSGSVDESV